MNATSELKIYMYMFVTNILKTIICIVPSSAEDQTPPGLLLLVNPNETKKPSISSILSSNYIASSKSYV